MRPDEHKKKRSEQYKKKHGIKGPKLLLDATKVSKKIIGPKSFEQPASKYEIGKKNEVSSSEEEHERSSVNFERRKVTSNWARYEETSSLTDENKDINATKGANFQELLQSSATNLSQFRFKDEQIWEEDLEIESTSAISINCDSLLLAVQCVPINERLSINTKHFQEEQLAHLKQCANNDITKYNNAFKHLKSDEKSRQESHSVLLKNRQLINSKDIKEINDCEVKVESTVSNQQYENMKASNTPEDITNVNQVHIKTENVDSMSETDLVTTNLVDEEEYLKEPTNNVIDDLDEILALSETKSVKVDNTTCDSKQLKQNDIEKANTDKDINMSQKSTYEHFTAVKNASFEDQLDQLLDLDAEKLKEKTAASIKNNSVEILKVDESSNLEDWLDTILDD